MNTTNCFIHHREKIPYSITYIHIMYLLAIGQPDCKLLMLKNQIGIKRNHCRNRKAKTKNQKPKIKNEKRKTNKTTNEQFKLTNIRII